MKNKTNKKQCDYSFGDDNWIYSNKVKDHFFNPKNILLNEKGYKYDSEGQIGNISCGDVMKVWLKINPKNKKIIECKWRTFGCAPAIASTSMMSEMITENGGMNIKKALKLKPEQIIRRLGGLPKRKNHCSVLGQEALKLAIENYINSNQK